MRARDEAHDDALIERIEQGMTTERDARVAERAMQRLALYEDVLRRIALHGSGPAAMLAAQALTGGLTDAHAA